MNNEPLVSVVIPTYNRTQKTFAAIDSVLGQSHSNVEVIIVDDGSTDGSEVAVEDFVKCKAAAGNRVRFVSQPNRGASAARNAGIAKAAGEYIAFLDSDDTWLPTKLESQLKVIERFKSECAACVTDARLVNDSGMDCESFKWQGISFPDAIGIDRDATRALAATFRFWVSTLVVRASTLRQMGGFNENISFVEDRDILFRLSLVTSIGYVNKPLIRTDRSPSPPGSTCRPWDQKELQFRQQQLMLESWLRLGVQLPSEIRRTVRQSLGASHSQTTNWNLEKRRYAEARQSVAMAVRYKTSPGIILKFLLTWLAPPLAASVAPKTRAVGTGGHAS
ncbi:MAG TPA: glycosyltransferase family 2 protein [Terracidiphilus sp.]|nr:glycosyltransferase family 2 protein [Terracidiphilus sp.]